MGMTLGRDAFLQRVRQAVQAGNRAGTAALEPRGQTGYQGAGPDPVARFTAECTAAGGQVYLVPGQEEAIAKVLDLVEARSLRKILLGRGRYLDSLQLTGPLRARGLEIVPVDGLTPAGCRDPLFAAEVGVSGVHYLVAETGTVVLEARPEEPRSLSLLPPVHIAVAHRSQVLPDLFDLFQAYSSNEGKDGLGAVVPSCLSLITGPSKTGDIELRLVTGVHGPGEVHIILVKE
jgi:L-lactate utilization protein LutC